MNQKTADQYQLGDVVRRNGKLGVVTCDACTAGAVVAEFMDRAYSSPDAAGLEWVCRPEGRTEVLA
jgi:hypothetical protein